MKKLLIVLLAAAPMLGTQAKEINIFEELVMPVLNAKCVACHGEKKVKGKLRMDSYEALVKGGSEGDTLVPGNLEKSLMWQRIILPLDDDDHMPPEDKTQLTKVEQAILKQWIAASGKPDAKVAEAKLGKDIQAYRKSLANRVDPAKLKEQLAAARKEIDAAMKQIPDLGVTIMPLSQESAELRLNTVNVTKTFGDKELAQIAPVAGHLAWVNLGRTQITDEGLSVISKMPKLSRLHLENTKVTDAGIDQIASAKGLKYLNLYGTEVTDAGVMKLAALPELEKVFLWQTKVTPEGAKQLQAKLPKTKINIGWEHEPPVKVVEPPKPKPAPDAKKPEPKKAAAGPAKTFAELAKHFDNGSCCFKSHAGGKVCKHPCCVKATAAKKVCQKCNPKTKGPKA